MLREGLFVSLLFIKRVFTVAGVLVLFSVKETACETHTVFPLWCYIHQRLGLPSLWEPLTSATLFSTDHGLSQNSRAEREAKLHAA